MPISHCVKAIWQTCSAVRWSGSYPYFVVHWRPHLQKYQAPCLLGTTDFCHWELLHLPFSILLWSLSPVFKCTAGLCWHDRYGFLLHTYQFEGAPRFLMWRCIFLKTLAWCCPLWGLQLPLSILTIQIASPLTLWVACEVARSEVKL